MEPLESSLDPRLTGITTELAHGGRVVGDSPEWVHEGVAFNAATLSLDADRSSLDAFVGSGGGQGRVLSFDVGEQPPPPEQVTTKVLIDSARLDEALERLSKSASSIDSLPPEAHRETGLVTVITSFEPAALGDFEDAPYIRRIEAPTRLSPALDTARGPATGLDDLLATPSGAGLDGSGVLVAIIDTGVDWTHPDFIDDNGASRIEQFIHAADGDPIASPSNYRTFDRDHITAALSAPATMPTGDPHGHGTHCASIAAGNGRASNGTYRGVAPGTDIFAMRNDGLFDIHTIEGIRRAFALAGDRPAVVSLSLGSHYGPHDGTSSLENEIARSSGPGRIVVCAAGNEASQSVHAHADCSAGPTQIPFAIADASQWIDVWVPRGDNVDLALEAPDGKTYVPNILNAETGHGRLRMSYVTDKANRDQHLSIQLTNGDQGAVWKLMIDPVSVVSGDVHAWGGILNNLRPAQIFIGATGDGLTLGMPASEERAIAVASFASRPFGTNPVGALSTFSSRGPTRIGAQKPDVAAPGERIVAARADGTGQPANGNENYTEKSGTSMATPFVAGVIALLLQRNPTLGPEQVQQLLRVTSRRDVLTGKVWNVGMGWGRLDCAALLQMLHLA